MSGGGGGGGTQVIEKSAEPWAEQRPYLVQGFQRAQQWLDSASPQYFPGSTVAPQSEATRAGIGALMQYAGQPGLIPQATATASDIMARGGGNPLASQTLANLATYGTPDHGQISAMQFFTGNGAPLTGNPTLEQLAAQGAGPNGGVDYLTAAARGDYLTPNNPYTAQVISNAQTLARAPIDAQFAGMGRYGSGSHAAALADSANRIATQALMQDYQQERQLQQGAAGQLATYGLSNAQLQAGAAQGLNSANLQNTALRLQGAQALQQAAAQQAAQQSDAAARLLAQGNQDAVLRLQAAGLLPTIDAANMNRINALLQSGQLQDQYAQALLQDEVNRWNFNQNRDLQKLQNYMALIGGQQYGSTEKATTPTTSTNPLLMGLGGAATGAMAGGALGSALSGAGLGSSLGPYGALAGAALGLLGGLFG